MSACDLGQGAGSGDRVVAEFGAHSATVSAGARFTHPTTTHDLAGWGATPFRPPSRVTVSDQADVRERTDRVSPENSSRCGTGPAWRQRKMLLTWDDKDCLDL